MMCTRLFSNEKFMQFLHLLFIIKTSLYIHSIYAFYTHCRVCIKIKFKIGFSVYSFCTTLKTPTAFYVHIIMSTKRIILKHFRQFVQSDWFLPVFISHDKDTASGLRIDPFKHRVLFSY